MKIQIHRNLQNVQTLDVTRILIFDKFNNPVAVAMDVGDAIVAETLDNEVAFRTLLKNIGVDNTFILRDVAVRPLPEINFT